MKVKAKRFCGVSLIFLFLCGLGQFFVPVTEGQQSSLVVDKTYWLRLANNAWKYFQPGVGVNSTTGLHSATLGYPYFTDWDLGVYIQATIDANKLGILNNTGSWGSDARFNKILSFLQTRQLSSNGVPYQWYQSANGNPEYTVEQDACDAGGLLVALNNLIVLKPDLAATINYIVYNKTNYTTLEKQVDFLANSKNIYDFYVASGFAGFWPSRFSTLASSILNNIVSAPTVSTYGVQVPISKLGLEPLLLSVFNLAPSIKLDGLVQKVFLAHEDRYKATTKFVAFSEGNTFLNNPTYVWEWVVKEDGSTWTIDDGKANVDIVPIIYFKAAVGLLAINNTQFTASMTSYVESHLPTQTYGYSDGIDENGRLASNVVDKTNDMIIEAALYAIDKLEGPTPTPSINPTSTPTSNPTTTSNPLPSNTIQSPSPNPSFYSQSPTSSTVDPLGANPLISWLVELVIVAILVFASLFVLLIVRFRRRNSAKSIVLSQQPGSTSK